MRYLIAAEVIELHELQLRSIGGGAGIRDLGGIESVVAQPQKAFGGVDLEPDLPGEARHLAIRL